MPYINGRRVTQDEWQAVNGSAMKRLRTGPNGENPAPSPVLDEETGAPIEDEPTQTKRSPRSAASAAAAIADATGVSVAEVEGSGTGDEQHAAALADAGAESDEKAAKAAEFKARMAAGRAAAKAKKEQS